MSNFPYLNKVRLKHGVFASSESDGFNGFFSVKTKFRRLNVLASDGDGWRHVSVSIPCSKDCPTWAEMCEVKDLFWDPGDTVMQIHPPHSDYINNHGGCLHLWQPLNQEIPRPPSEMVGLKELNPP